MTPRVALFLVFPFILLPGFCTAALTPADHPLFTEDAVHEIRLTFHQADWWDQLVDNYENNEDIPYLAAQFDWGTTHIDSIGVRIKGNSSYMYPGVKKSFKLDINEYISGQEIFGLDKLNLNNCFLDPSFVREKCAYELCEELGLPTVRTNYSALYINDTFWGLYLLVEQFDSEFIESRFGAGEEGNLWKGEPHGSLEDLGPDQAAYYNSYELKTNEEANDWSDLVQLVDLLNNTPLADLPDSLHGVLDVNSALAMMAVDNFTVNLDSYVGRCANYYLYHRELDDRFVFAKWDQNEAFGVFNMWGYSISQLEQLPVNWSNPQEPRPLVNILLQVPQYYSVYTGHMKKLRAGTAEPDRLVARMEELRDLIRPFVQQDGNMMFSFLEFEIAMTSTVVVQFGPPPGRPIPALEYFVRHRDASIEAQIGSWTPPIGLVLNELMSDNQSTITDEFGDHDDWIEISNNGNAPIDLSGLGLTDHFEGFDDFIFPDTSLAPGQYLIVWADKEIVQGDLHAPFKLDADGESIFLTDAGVIIDGTNFPAMGTDICWARIPDGEGPWQLLSTTTPGSMNDDSILPEEITLFINEFIAVNNMGIQDELGEFEDWLELYNPGLDPVDLGGLYLSDDLTDSTCWALPDTVIDAGGFLVIWCDDDPEDGPLHTTFKLSGSGEEIGLFGRLAAGNELIDSRVFGPQTADISEGRIDDGEPGWVFFNSPTPGSSNNALTNLLPPSELLLVLSNNYPNPFNPQTTFRFNLPGQGRASLSIYDARGQLVVCLHDGVLVAGSHTIAWNGRSHSGGLVSSGIYFSRLEFLGQVRTGRLTMIK